MASLVSYASSDDENDTPTSTAQPATTQPASRTNGAAHTASGSAVHIDIPVAAKPLFASLPAATTHHIALPLHTDTDPQPSTAGKPSKKRKRDKQHKRERDGAAQPSNTGTLVLPAPKHNAHKHAHTAHSDTALVEPAKTGAELELEQLLNSERIDADDNVQIEFDAFVDEPEHNDTVAPVKHELSQQQPPAQLDSAAADSAADDDELPPGITVLPVASDSTHTTQSTAAPAPPQHNKQWRQFVGRHTDLDLASLPTLYNTQLAERNAQDQRLYEFERDHAAHNTAELKSKVYNARTGTDITVSAAHSNVNRGKHQIGQVAAASAALEVEMERKRALGIQHRKHTKNKYGW